jgi:hypothetical protein
MAPALLRLLKAYKPSAVQCVTVGMVGLLNVGKSSLINTLKWGPKVCRRVPLGGSSNLPGVVFEHDDSTQGQMESSVLLCNVVKPEDRDVNDPVSVGASFPCSPSRPLSIFF